MYPGTLVSYVYKLEQIFVKTDFFASRPKQWLMRSGCTGGHYDPVQIEFLYLLLDRRDPFFGTGVQVMLSMHYIRQLLNILRYLGNIYISPDIYATVTHENANAGIRHA